MIASLTLLREEPRARLFFAALTQSALGTGAAYVGLLLIAYDRFESPWAIGLVLLADFLPSVLLGPFLGAAADRWSRRWCAVTADVIRAVAFIGIVVVHSFEVTVAFALLAGVGTALFKPAVLAGLPHLVATERRASATALYGAITDLGYTAGPAIAAAALLVASPEGIMAVNGATFAVSALVLVRVPLGGGSSDADAHEGTRPSLFAEAREGMRLTAGMAPIRAVILCSAGAMFFGGLFNVSELLFATEELDAGESGYSVLVALFGLGFVAGSLGGSSGGSLQRMKHRYLVGTLVMGLGFALSGVASGLVPALLTFALAGWGNGLMLVHERLLIQTDVPDRLQGRVFGVSEGLVSAAFTGAFFSAGALITLTGTRELMVLTGAGVLLVAATGALALRKRWITTQPSRLRGRPGLAAAAVPRTRDQGPDVVGHEDFWLTLLNDLLERDDDRGVELRSRVRS